MSGAVISLTASYAMLGLLLLSLNLNSAWPWTVKALAIGTALPLFLATFLALQALMGWPSAADLPENFELHAALVEEPSKDRDHAGSIYLWITPVSGTPEETPDDVVEAAGLLPRAFTLPYSRDLHNKVEAMREALQKGQMVAGSHKTGSPWERRFGEQRGGIDLFTPPPPSLPPKDG